METAKTRKYQIRWVVSSGSYVMPFTMCRVFDTAQEAHKWRAELEGLIKPTRSNKDRLAQAHHAERVEEFYEAHRFSEWATNSPSIKPQYFGIMGGTVSKVYPVEQVCADE